MRRAVSLMAVVLLALPLLSAVVQDAEADAQKPTENIVVHGKDGWRLELGTRDGKRGGFGVFLIDKGGVARGRLIVDGASPRIDVCNAKAEHGAALESEDEATSAIGIWSGEHWRLRSEIKRGQPICGTYDAGGRQRMRYGLLKGDSYLTLIGDDGKTDRAWMMAEAAGRGSIAVRGEKRAEASLGAGVGEPVGVSVRDSDGTMRALMYTYEDESYVVAYDKNETSRAVLKAAGKGVVGLELIDANDRPRGELGYSVGEGARLRLRDGEGKVVHEVPTK